MIYLFSCSNYEDQPDWLSYAVVKIDPEVIKKRLLLFDHSKHSDQNLDTISFTSVIDTAWFDKLDYYTFLNDKQVDELENDRYTALSSFDIEKYNPETTQFERMVISNYGIWWAATPKHSSLESMTETLPFDLF